MKPAVAYAASPDFAEQTKLAGLRAEHRKQLTDTQAKQMRRLPRYAKSWPPRGAR